MSRLNKRDSQAGGIMAATIVILAGLASVTALTVLSVKRSLSATSEQRAHAQAINAAESGLVVAGKFLRDRFAVHPALRFSPELQDPTQWNLAYGAGRNQGPVTEYPFGDHRLGYDIAYRNNASDPGGTTVDTDSTVVIIVTGCTGAVVDGVTGTACIRAGGARAQLEVEVTVGSTTGLLGTGADPQQNGELGTGRDDGIGPIDSTNTSVVTPN